MLVKISDFNGEEWSSYLFKEFLEHDRPIAYRIAVETESAFPQFIKTTYGIGLNYSLANEITVTDIMEHHPHLMDAYNEYGVSLFAYPRIEYSCLGKDDEYYEQYALTKEVSLRNFVNSDNFKYFDKHVSSNLLHEWIPNVMDYGAHHRGENIPNLWEDLAALTGNDFKGACRNLLLYAISFEYVISIDGRRDKIVNELIEKGESQIQANIEGQAYWRDAINADLADVLEDEKFNHLFYDHGHKL
jgi:uncharacterized protein with ATP-grasp and redox domains